TARHDGYTSPVTFRQQRRQRALVRKRVAPREQNHVDLRCGERIETDLHVIDADAVAAQRAFGLELGERGQRSGHRLANAAWRIVACAASSLRARKRLPSGAPPMPMRADSVVVSSASIAIAILTHSNRPTNMLVC